MSQSFQTFDQKIMALRMMHGRSHPDARRQIDQWELDFARIKATKEWLEHPNTKELHAIAVTQLRTLYRTLMLDDTLTDEKRKELHALRKTHEVYLSTLTGDVTQSMENIEKLVDQELKSHE